MADMRQTSEDFADVIREAVQRDKQDWTITRVVTTFAGHTYHLSTGEVFDVIVKARVANKLADAGPFATGLMRAR